MTGLPRKAMNRVAETEGPAAQDTAAGPAGPPARSGATATADPDDASAAPDTGTRAPGPAGGAGGSQPAGDADEDGGHCDAEGTPDVRGSGSRFAGRWHTAAAAGAVALLLLGGSAFFYGAHQLRATPSARNRALTDTATTERVSGEVSDGLARIFSYTPAGADATARSARTVLGGKAARQYGDLFTQLRANLETQKITLNTRAVRTGVIELDGDTARLLVLLDQTSRRDEGATTSAAAQLTVIAQFQDNRWQIVDIKTR